VQILDWRRLGKQRVEARQILKTLIVGGGWINHPAVKMWRGYESALIAYSNAAIMEWLRRGYRNTMEILPVECWLSPPWLGDLRFHASHRSNLLRKDPRYYGQFGWSEAPDLPYYWPV
jgi:hypothetical protein